MPERYLHFLLLVFLTRLWLGASMSGGPIRTTSLSKLVRLATNEAQGGLVTSFDSQVIEGMYSIESEFPSKSKSYPSILGSWKLLWSTEKEINFFYSGMWPFSKAVSVTQRVTESAIENCINFGDGGYLRVDGTAVQADGNADQTAFSFTTAKVRIGENQNLAFTVPPIGSGVFKTMYANQKYRLSRDLKRGDYSIFERL